MEYRRKTIAVVLAGGVGARIGAGIPKQLIVVGGRPLLAYPLETFASHDRIDTVVVVMAEGFEDAAKTIFSGEVITGGSTRTASTLRALERFADEPDDTRILFHDAARAFVDHGVIDRCLDALDRDACVSVALPVTDTIIAVSAGHVADAPPRDALARVQTPQGFRLGTLRRAYEKALADPGFVATDDCGVVHRYLPGVPVRVVEGDDRLVKITTPLDLVVAEHLAATR
ncbi:2-C-methyl-D-erythritol 4-phosphate cytidylyltransferase [Actinocorallia longicatena]|uniref:2-C-methyl-D-erythritol 4-phosphate cytidylyltransferase n=1 Tax=Actinocorallia longicatena TaxID=111803 RepID=A0ABP6QJC1_9ACTN